MNLTIILSLKYKHSILVIGYSDVNKYTHHIDL